jgi:hypothetical protein
MNTNSHLWLDPAIRVAAAGLGAAVAGPLGGAVGAWIAAAMGPAVSDLIQDSAKEFGVKAGEKLLEFGGEWLNRQSKQPALLQNVWREALRLSLRDIRRLNPTIDIDQWFDNWDRCLAKATFLNLEPIAPDRLVPENLDTLFRSTMERLDAQGSALKRSDPSILPPTRTIPDALADRVVRDLPASFSAHLQALIAKREYDQAWKEADLMFKDGLRLKLDNIARHVRSAEEHTRNTEQLVTALSDRLKSFPPAAIDTSNLKTIYFLIAPDGAGADSYQALLQAELLHAGPLRDSSYLTEFLPLHYDPDNPRSYGNSYKLGFEHFRHHANPGDWLFTIQPEQESWFYEPKEEERFTGEFAAAGKRIIFFESGGDLLDVPARLRRGGEWSEKWKEPFTVIKTDNLQAFQEMLQHMAASPMFDRLGKGDPFVLITMPGPCTFVAQERREVYQTFLSDIYSAHCRSTYTADTKNPRHQICSELRKVELRTAATVWLSKWKKEFATETVSALLGMCDFSSPNCKVLFLCGNDTLALGAREAVLSASHGDQAIGEHRVAFFGIDGSEEFTNLLSAGLSGFTLTVNYRQMRELAEEVLNHPATYAGKTRLATATPWNA